MWGNNGSLELQTFRKKCRRFVVDSHARFQEKSHADKFLEIISKQDQ